MNRYDHHFQTLAAHLRSTPVHRVGFASGALFEHRANGFGWEDDEAIVRQFDLSGLAEFWEIQLSEPMACVDFTRSLARHFYKLDWRPGLSEEEQRKLGPAAERVNDSIKVGIRQALRAARSYGEPWFMVIPDPPPSSKLDHRAALRRLPGTPQLVPSDLPVDGIDLNKLRVQPRAAVEWMLSSAQRRHLVPPSLVAYLAPPLQWVEQQAAPLSEITAKPVDLPPLQEATRPSEQPRNRGGRPKIYDWTGGLGYLAAYIVQNDPHDKAELRHVLTEWFDKQGKSPDEREIRKHADELWEQTRIHLPR